MKIDGVSPVLVNENWEFAQIAHFWNKTDFGGYPKFNYKIHYVLDLRRWYYIYVKTPIFRYMYVELTTDVTYNRDNLISMYIT